MDEQDLVIDDLTNPEIKTSSDHSDLQINMIIWCDHAKCVGTANNIIMYLIVLGNCKLNFDVFFKKCRSENEPSNGI